jgi:glutamyl-tRNA synthetase
MVLLGWSLDDRTEVMPVEQVVENFTLERVGKPAAIFDMERLQWMNGVYIRQLTTEELAERMIPFLERDLPPELLPVDRDYLLRIVPLIQERLKLLADSADLTGYFFQTRLDYDPAGLVQRGIDQTGTMTALQRAQTDLAAVEDFDHQRLEDLLRAAGDDLGIGPRPFFGALRVATTGRTATPPLFETMEVLGKERVLGRIGLAIELLSGL